MRYPLRHWGDLAARVGPGVRNGVNDRLHGAMAARRIPEPKVRGSNPSGVIFCCFSVALFFSVWQAKKKIQPHTRTQIPKQNKKIIQSKIPRPVAQPGTHGGSMAEWLRRLIRNQLGVARGSSNLSAVGFCLCSAVVDFLTCSLRVVVSRRAKGM